jgi:hypothetical protein
MTTADPYIVPIPERITDQNGQPSREFLDWLIYDNRWKHDIWQQLGGGTNIVVDGTEEASANEDQINYLKGYISNLEDKIEDLEAGTPNPNIPIEFNTKTVTASYSAAPHDFINAKSGALITLPKYPPTNSVIIIRNGDGSTITINPNGKTLNGETSVISTDLGTALVLHYFIDSDEWLIR